MKHDTFVTNWTTMQTRKSVEKNVNNLKKTSLILKKTLYI